jgi:hypothetical protein
MFNVWEDEENGLPTTTTKKLDESSKISRLHPNFYQQEIEDNNTSIIQHDSPFLERSDSLTDARIPSEQLFNNDYLNRY